MQDRPRRIRTMRLVAVWLLCRKGRGRGRSGGARGRPLRTRSADELHDACEKSLLLACESIVLVSISCWGESGVVVVVSLVGKEGAPYQLEVSAKTFNCWPRRLRSRPPGTIYAAASSRGG